MANRLAMLIVMLLTSSVALAAGKEEVLDFDADVIEGQKKTPEVFFQMEVEKPALDAVLYLRKDFNDFHAIDSRQRPRQSEPPRRATKK